MAAYYDLKLFDGAGVTMDPPTRFAPGRTTGPARAAANFAYALLTPRGSVPGSAVGTDLVDAVTGGLAGDVDLASAFAFAVDAAVSWLRDTDPADTPAGERVQTVNLLGITVADGSVTFSCVVVFADGTGGGLTIPVSVAPVEN